MLVQCPNCKTTYKVSDEVLKGAAPAFRCSRCRHTFELETEEPSEPPPQPGLPSTATVETPTKEEELSFSFPSREILPSAPPEHPEGTPREGIEAPVEKPSSAAMSAPDEWALHADTKSAMEEPRFTEGAEPPAPSDSNATAIGYAVQPDAAADEERERRAQNILAMSSYLDQQASILPFLTLFALIVIGFSLAAVITYAHPKTSEELVKKIPLFGAAVVKNTHLKNGILLQSLRGGYQMIQGNREVFVITGVAINQNPVVIREVQLTGKIRNENGKELEQQTVWVGNTLSAKILRGMTLEDIPHLQSLKPLKSFEMPPGDSVPFAMVFLKANKAVKDFSCAVAFADSDA